MSAKLSVAPAPPPDMSTQLRLEFEGYAAMEDLLLKEEEALLSMQSERVVALADEKEHLTRQLEALAAQRTTLLARHGLAGNASGMREWLASHTEDSKETGLAWNRLQALSECTHRLNNINGRLINALLVHVQARLSVISGPAGANPTYGSNGLTRHAHTPKALGQA